MLPCPKRRDNGVIDSPSNDGFGLPGRRFYRQIGWCAWQDSNLHCLRSIGPLCPIELQARSAEKRRGTWGLRNTENLRRFAAWCNPALLSAILVYNE